MSAISRFLPSLALVATLAITSAACKSKHNEDNAPEAGSTPPAPPVPMQSVLAMSDAHAGQQLVSGFFDLTAGTWRWTAGKFSVLLHTPTDAATKGAKLQLQLTIPEVVIKKLNNLTLSAKAGDFALPPQSFDKHGSFTYDREIPASALTSDTVRIDFSLDKTMPGTTADPRQLGIIVSSVALAPR